MKRCFKCKRYKARRFFYKHPEMADGLLGKCRSCTKKDVAANYRARLEQYKEYERKRFQYPERKQRAKEYQARYRQKHPGKYRAHNATSYAVRDGHMKRQPCEVCGEAKSEAHHEDYRKPLDVRWLCLFHHRAAEGRNVLAMARP